MTRADHDDRIPPHILIVYPLVFVPLLAAWIGASFGAGWLAAVAVLVLWTFLTDRRERREDAARPLDDARSAHSAAEVAFATSPGPWSAWRERTHASYGRVVPVLAPLEWACQWVWFAGTRWAVVPVVLGLALLWAVFSGEARAHDGSEARAERRTSYLAAFGTTGPTGAGSVRRDALRSLLLADAPGGELPLDGWDLRRSEILAHRVMTSVSLRDADLRHASLAGTGLENADLRRADLSSATLTGADLRHARLDASRAIGAVGRRLGARHCTLTRGAWAAADLQDAEFEFANLTRTDFADADLRGADLRHATLTGCGLAGADLRGANCIDADFSDSDLGAATWEVDDLVGALWRDGSIDWPVAAAERLKGRTRRIRHADGSTWIVVAPDH